MEPNYRKQAGGVGETAGGAGGAATAGAGRPAKRKRRWLRRLAVLPVLLVALAAALVAALPWLISTKAGTGLLLGVVSQQTGQVVGARAVSLAWLGPCRVWGLTVRDGRGRPLVEAEQIEWAPGLWRGWRAPEQLGELRLAGVQAWVRSTAAPTGQEQGKEQKPKAPAQPREIPKMVRQLTGRVSLENGRVELVQSDGKTLEISDIAGRIDLATLNDVKGQMSCRVGGGEVQAQAAVGGLLAGGAPALRGARVTASVATPTAVDLAPLAAFAMGETLRGQGRLDVQVEGQEGNIEAKVSAVLKGLASPALEEATGGGRPLDVKVEAGGRWAGEQITGQATASSEAGEVKTSFRLPSKLPAGLTGQAITAAVLTGEKLEVPEVEMEASGEVSLARLAEAAPALLRVRKDVRISSGTLALRQATLQGGQHPELRVVAEMKDLAAEVGGRPVRYEPVIVDLDAGLEAGTGLVVRRGEVKAAFARVEASGTPTELTGRFEVDLEKLQVQLTEIIELPSLELGGAATGTVAVKRAGSERLTTSVDAAVRELRYVQGGRRVEASAATLRARGELLLAGGAVRKVTVSEAQATVNGEEVVVTGSGWQDLEDGGLAWEAEVKRAEVASLSGLAAGLGHEEMKGWTGRVEARAKVERRAGGQALTSAGEMRLLQPAVNARPLSTGENELAAVWRGLEVDALGQSVRLEQAEAKGLGVEVLVQSLRAGWGGRAVQADCRAEARSDLRRLGEAWAAARPGATTPALAGQFRWSGSCRTAGATVDVVGGGEVQGLQVGTGQQAFREERVRFTHDAQWDGPAKGVRVRQTTVESRPLTLELSGTVERYDGDRVLDLRGRYEADWDELTKLLVQVAPQTAETVAVRGRSSGELAASGPARQLNLQPVFQQAKGGGRLSWESAEVYGVKLEGASLAPKLEGGRLVLEPTTIAANGGSVRPGATVDWETGRPRLRLPARTMLLENVSITPVLDRYLLSRYNPVFADMAGVEGKVSLYMDSFETPLDAAWQQGLRAAGRVEFKQMRLVPGGLLGEVLQLSGRSLEGWQSADMRPVEFTVRDGQVRYENFAVSFAGGLTLSFSGAVGLDGRTNLAVSVPIAPELLKRLGVQGPLSEYARVLAGTTLNIPVRGAAGKPVLDFSQVNPGSLIQKAMEATLQERVLGGVRGAGPVEREVPRERSALPEPQRKQAPSAPPPPKESRPAGKEKSQPAKETKPAAGSPSKGEPRAQETSRQPAKVGAPVQLPTAEPNRPRGPGRRTPAEPNGPSPERSQPVVKPAATGEKSPAPGKAAGRQRPELPERPAPAVPPAQRQMREQKANQRQPTKT